MYFQLFFIILTALEIGTIITLVSHLRVLPGECWKGQFLLQFCFPMIIFFLNEGKHLAQRVVRLIMPINLSGKFLNDSVLELPTSLYADVL